MQKRGITIKEVKRAVMYPDHFNVSKFGCYESFKRIGGKNIKVVYELRDAQHAHVVTVKKAGISL